MPKALGLFWLQFRVLTWKNWVVISSTPFVSILRCLLLPIAYGVFLSFAQFMLHRLNNYGPGSAAPIPSLKTQFDGTKMLYLADATTHNTFNISSPTDIMLHALAGFTDHQLAAVQLTKPQDIPEKCPQNFNGYSSCYAAVVFTDMDPNGATPQGFNYTLFADAGLNHIDVERHTSDVVQRLLPLQWAIDKAIIELQTNVSQVTPLEWGYSNQTNAQQQTAIRLSYTRGIRQIIGLAFFLAFVGITYQISGSAANERALLITEHMKAMGLYDSARIMSWHISISLTYLPGWLIVALLWKGRVFTETSGSLIVFVHILVGMVLASWSLAVSVPLGESPQLAAVVTTFLSIVFAILGMVVDTSSTFILSFLSLIFPPSFYIFALKAICGYENNQLATDPMRGDPDRGIFLAPLICVAVLDIIIWPFLAVALERYLYSTATMFKPSKEEGQLYPIQPIPADTAISIRNLTKIYSASFWNSKGDVTAVSNLCLDIPKTGIFVMLGSNGAGKSTSLAIMAGLSSITKGTVTFDGGYERPPRGVMGIVPQKNVLFPDLTCMQTLQVWRAVKWSTNRYETDADLVRLLQDCDLGKKIHADADTLSGGQKRKLQLAIGLLGGSKIVLVDECTSGVDPLSRRALWKTLSAFRNDRCIVFTTHFLDEADLLADNIAILAAPGKVVAHGSPVALKRGMGEGYSVQVTFGSLSLDSDPGNVYGHASISYDLLHNIKIMAPDTYVTKPSPAVSVYHLKTRDSVIVSQVLSLLEEEERQHHIQSYDILATTIEDIFLDLMSREQAQEKLNHTKSHSASSSLDNLSSASLVKPAPIMDLPNGKAVNPYRQAFTIFHKRMLIARRSWMTPLLAILIAVTGATIPLTFTAGLEQRCIPRTADITAVPLFLPNAPFAQSDASQDSFPRMLVSPPNLLILSGLGRLTADLTVSNVVNETIFSKTIQSDRHNLALGGISFNPSNGSTVVAWEASPPGIRAPAMLNMASNVLLQSANNSPSSKSSSNGQAVIIATNYGAFAKVASATLMYLRWIFFFGAVMAVYPAFFSLYVTKERRSDVQAMQLSNGLNNPIGLWLGHLMFDTITSIIISTIIVVVFSTVSHQFHGLGLLWIVLVLYGITATLFSYCLSLMASSALAAFAIVAGYQFIMLVLYLSSYMLVFTFGSVNSEQRLTTIIHFSISMLAPIDNLIRATLVSVNLFSLLCQGTDEVTTGSLLKIGKLGGPILYLVVHAFILLGILVWVDSGSQRPRPLRRITKPHAHRRLLSTSSLNVNNDAIITGPQPSSQGLLHAVGISKAFNGKQVTDNVNLDIQKNTIFALLGPNGAGKTTTFKIIRGDVIPDSGDVLINGHSIVTNPRLARMSLGVCPQFTAIDDQLTVREHLIIYGRLKGLDRGRELNSSVEAVLEGTSLMGYADRLASKLSGGNQRKLSLAIALLGNPPVILIDEFSTGVDPKMKRDMWQTLRRVAVGKAIIITTHSMEEASALATNVGILSKRMLALGTTASLATRYGTYEVQFVCRTREEVSRARELMSHIPGACMADDVATRFEVPISSSSRASYCLAELFNTLSQHSGCIEYTVERGSLESVFLKVIKDNNAKEEGYDYSTWTSKSAPSFWQNF